MTPQERRKHMHKLLDLALDIQDSGAGLAFFDYAGHVDAVRVKVDRVGRTDWNAMEAPVYKSGALYFDGLTKPKEIVACAYELEQLNCVKEAA